MATKASLDTTRFEMNVLPVYEHDPNFTTDENYMILCLLFCRVSMSKRGNMGALVVDPTTNKIVLSANNTPMIYAPGQKPGKAEEIHAEARCVSLAAKEGISLAGCTVYVSLAPCASCFMSLCTAGIKRCVYRKRPLNKAMVLLAEMEGVELVQWEDEKHDDRLRDRAQRFWTEQGELPETSRTRLAKWWDTWLDRIKSAAEKVGWETPVVAEVVPAKRSREEVAKEEEAAEDNVRETFSGTKNNAIDGQSNQISGVKGFRQSNSGTMTSRPPHLLQSSSSTSLSSPSSHPNSHLTSKTKPQLNPITIMSDSYNSSSGGVGVGAGADNSQLDTNSYSSRTTQGSDYQDASSGGNGSSYTSGTEPRTDSDYVPRDDPSSMKDAPRDSGAYTGNDNVEPSDAEGRSAGAGEEVDEDGYPTQRPEYNKGTGFADKMDGQKEILKGKLTGNKDLVEHGHLKRSGELKKKEQEEDDQSDPFAKPGEEDKAQPTKTVDEEE